MTKNEVKFNIQLAMNLAGQAKQILGKVCDSLTDNIEDGADDMYDLVDAILGCEVTDVNEAMESLDEYILSLPKGDQVPAVKVDVRYLSTLIEISTERQDGSKLTAEIDVSNIEGPQTAVTFTTPDGDIMDLFLAAMDPGENGDFSYRFWGDVSDEDPTLTNVITMDEIEEAFGGGEDDDELIYRITSPDITWRDGEIERVLDEAGCDYDYDSGDRMIISLSGMKALNKAGIDYDEV